MDEIRTQTIEIQKDLFKVTAELNEQSNGYEARFT